jgi:predicted GNAT family N-acyltransferase
VADEPDIAVIEAVLGSDLYRQALRLRELVLRRPLGLTITEEELADDAIRHHFTAISYGMVIGTVSLRPLDETTLQLKQMAVAEDRRHEGIGTRLLAHVEGWGNQAGFLLMVLHARIGAEGFYARHDYAAEGEPFDEHTIPHIRMAKRLD